MNKISLEDCIKNTSGGSNAKKALMSTGSSFPFKSITRQKKASWGNRIVKDFNDLSYDLPIDLIQQSTIKGHKVSGLQQFKKSSTINFRQKSKSPQSSRHKHIDKKYLTKNDYTTPKQIRVEKIKLSRDNKFTTVDTSGLSQFEYKNSTIHGRLMSRSNHHLAFENQPKRKVNQYQVWYNPELSYSHQLAKKKKQRKVRQKMHSFDSYTDRQVFEPKDTIDQFYRTEQLWRKTSPIRIKQIVQLNKITGRKQANQSLASSLQMKYETRKAEQIIKRKPYSFAISNLNKQFKISRQVISSERGCFR